MDFLTQYSDRILPEPNSGCWFWMGQVNQYGYGRIHVGGGRTKPAHRVSFENAGGVVPETMQLDHLCRVRCCVNPAHLEAVTQQENIRRAVAYRRGMHPGSIQPGRCPDGHELTGDNLQVRKNRKYVGTVCRTCARISRLKWRNSPNGIRSHAVCNARYESKNRQSQLA